MEEIVVDISRRGKLRWIIFLVYTKPVNILHHIVPFFFWEIRKESRKIQKDDGRWIAVIVS